MRTVTWLLPLTLALGLAAAPGGCDADNDGDGFTPAAGDCDDTDPTLNPAAIEACDGIDNNCDGVIDEGFDEDADGVSTCGGDCDDADAAVSPLAQEGCDGGDGRDQDCDGAVDESPDDDADGFFVCESPGAPADCDDADPLVNPGAPERCTGGVATDDDCDGLSDEGFDGDADGFTTCGSGSQAPDCDDTNAATYPTAQERCNGLDDNCDGDTDEGFDLDADGQTTCAGDCDDADASIYQGATEVCDAVDQDCDGATDEGFDLDGDGALSCAGDCDDSDAGVLPGATEVCDGADQDCDGATDEGFDLDGDGYTTCGATGPADCDDTNAGVSPGAVEVCDFVDQDCDGLVDDGFDADRDGYTTCGGDCNDNRAATHPGVAEACNGIDDNCDGRIDDGYDNDADGYTTCAGDCDDTRATDHPGAVEGPSKPATQTDGRDNDCDGYVDIDCDGTAVGPEPMVVIETPQRGLFTSSSSVTVSGRVLPANNKARITVVSVEGGSAQLTRCSADGGALFTGTRSLTRGLTTLRVTATDVGGAKNKAESSVISSSRYINVRSGTMGGALVGELNQGTWNILADYLEGSLSEEGMEDSLIASNPIINDSGDADCLESWKIYGEATAYRHQDVQITFTISGGKVRSTARLIRPEMWAQGYAKYDLEWYCGGWSDTVDLTAYARFDEVLATADGVLAMKNGAPSVTFSNVVVAASGPYLNVDADTTIYDWLLDLFEDDMEQQLEQFVEAELGAFVSQELGPLLTDELNAMELSYDVGVAGVNYGVDFNISSLVVPTGTVDVGFSVAYDYDVDARTPANPGAIGHTNTYTRTTSPTVALKVGMDFFNAAFHTLWEGGSLYIEGPLSTAPPIYGVAVPLLPPVVVPSTSPYLMLLELGDVLTTLEIDDGHGGVQVITAAASARVPLDIDPWVDGYDIRFDANFGAVQLSFDVLTEQSPDAELQAAMEEGLSEMLTLYLDELEVYLEAQAISYLALPVQFSSLSIAADTSNNAMLTISGQATYAGP